MSTFPEALPKSAGIHDAFGADHERLDDCFRQFQESKRTDPIRAKEAFKSFKHGLQRHIIWEEDVLFPLFEKKTGMRGTGPTEVMRQEHQRIGAALEEIHTRVRQGDANSDADEQTLLELLAAHNLKEETVLYPSLDRFLNEAEKAEAFARMSAMPPERYQTCCGH